MTARYWSVDETAQALKLRSEGLTDQQIGVALNRTPDSVYSRLHYRAFADVRPRHDVRKASIRTEIPVASLAEAARVEGSPMTLSMVLCGDPRLGRSVLDRRLAGIPEPEVSRPVTKPVISLPSVSETEVARMLAALQCRYPEEGDGNDELC